MLMVAPTGSTKRMMRLSMWLFSRRHLKVIGRVAELQCKQEAGEQGQETKTKYSTGEKHRFPVTLLNWGRKKKIWEKLSLDYCSHYKQPCALKIVGQREFCTFTWRRWPERWVEPVGCLWYRQWDSSWWWRSTWPAGWRGHVAPNPWQP